MKNSYLLFFICCFQLPLAQAQKSSKPDFYEYIFNGNFAETNGKSTSLKPLGEGNFSSGNFSDCGNKKVYNFSQNSGLAFDNTKAANFLGKEYTIELYFKMQNLSSWRRIVEYKNRTSDTGPYVFNNQIQFYNLTPSETFPFSENVYSHVVLTRSNTGSKTYSMYVDGVLRFSFEDTGENGVLDATNILNFFQDDLTVQNEASAGAIAFLRLYNYVLTPTQIADNFARFPCLMLASAAPNFLHIYPNSAAKGTTILVRGLPPGTPNVKARLLDKAGRQVWGQLIHGYDLYSFIIPTSVASGVYSIEIETTKGVFKQFDIAIE